MSLCGARLAHHGHCVPAHPRARRPCCCSAGTARRHGRLPRPVICRRSASGSTVPPALLLAGRKRLSGTADCRGRDSPGWAGVLLAARRALGPRRPPRCSRGRNGCPVWQPVTLLAGQGSAGGSASTSAAPPARCSRGGNACPARQMAVAGDSPGWAGDLPVVGERFDRATRPLLAGRTRLFRCGMAAEREPAVSSRRDVRGPNGHRAGGGAATSRPARRSAGGGSSTTRPRNKTLTRFTDSRVGRPHPPPRCVCDGNRAR